MKNVHEDLNLTDRFLLDMCNLDAAVDTFAWLSLAILIIISFGQVSPELRHTQQAVESRRHVKVDRCGCGVGTLFELTF